MDDCIHVRVTHGNTVTIAEIDLGIGIVIIGEAKLHPNDMVYNPVIGSSYAVGRAMTTAGKYLTDAAAELVDGNGCQCPACQIVKHWSDCALHGAVNEAGEISHEGPCDCNALEVMLHGKPAHGGTYSVESDDGSTGPPIPYNATYEETAKIIQDRRDEELLGLQPQPGDSLTYGGVAHRPEPPDIGWDDVKPGWFERLLKRLRS